MLSSFFPTYPAGVDFVLYLFAFIVACRRAAAWKLPGRNGQTIAIAVAVVSAIALSTAETVLGFSTRPLGPVAAGAILILTFWQYAARRRLAVRSSSHQEQVPTPSAADAGQADSLAAARQVEVTERELVRHKLKEFAADGRHECRKVIGLLQAVIAVLRERGDRSHAEQVARKAMQTIGEHEHELLLALTHIRQLDQRLIRFDLSECHNLRQRYERLPPLLQQQCRRLFLEEREKLGVETEIDHTARSAEKVIRQSDLYIDGAKQDMDVGSLAGAAMWLERAIGAERMALKLCEHLRELEKRLLGLVEKQIDELDSR